MELIAYCGMSNIEHANNVELIILNRDTNVQLKYTVRQSYVS